MNDSRRHCLVISAAACAGLTVIALPAIADADPIFAAIDTHRGAVSTFETMHARMVEEELIASNGAALPLRLAGPELQAVFSATLAPGAAVLDTAPTTHAGLRALANYLREDSVSSSMLRDRIWYPRTFEGIAFPPSDGSQESVDWLIAKRAAEIDRAA